jgi:hypothetical protein
MCTTLAQAALVLQLMTRLRLARVALASVTRQGTVTLVQVDLTQCAAVTIAAALTPLKGGAAVHTLMNTGTRFAVNARLKIPALDDLGVDTSGEGEPLPPWLTLPRAPPPPPPPQPQRGGVGGPQAPQRRTNRNASPPSPPPIGAGAPLEALYAVDPEEAAAAVADSSAGTFGIIAATVGAATAATRADIHARIGTECEALFDTLHVGSKARLRGRADELFKHLAHGPLFPRERLADAAVNTVKDSELNEPRAYAPVVDAAELRPAVVQVLIRTAQRLLNAETVHCFARTRGKRASDELADGVTARDFLERVVHHSRRDLWTPEAVEWADSRVDAVLERLHAELRAFLGDGA